MKSLYYRDDITSYAWCSGGYDIKMLFVTLLQSRTIYFLREG